MDNNFVAMVVDGALVTSVLLIIATCYRFIKGPSIADRILALDLITTLLVGTIVLFGVLNGVTFLIDLGIALAALAFISTVALARYVAEGRVF